MVKFYKQPFAHDGDAIAIPDASQPDGKMSSADGWTPDYQLPKTDPNYKPVGRQEMNGVFKEVTEALGQVQVQGAASWSADGAPYPINAQVYHNSKQWIALRANSVEPAEGADWTEFRSLSLRENTKVTVGAGGDFPTINAAVLHLSRFTLDLGVTAEVELMSGFVMEEQLLVDGLNLGWITITGVDAETVVNEPSLTRELGGRYPVFGVKGGGVLPAIGQLFRFNSKGDVANGRDGVLATGAGSSANILADCGVQDAGSHGIYAYESATINAPNAVASGAGGDGIRAVSGSTISAEGADASGAGSHGIHAYKSATISAEGADASGAGSNGARAASSSTIDALGVDASGAGVGFFVGTGSTINARNAAGALSQTENTISSGGIIFQ